MHEPRPLRADLPLALFFAAIKLALQVAGSALAQHAGYGIFRDELYYLVCGRNLAWGYLDQPPLVAVEARLSELLFGLHSLPLLRLGAGLAGAIEVALTVLLTLALGGGRVAQALAALGVLCSPIIMGVARAARPVPALWLAIGALAGIGLLNKWNIAFFLLAATAGLLLRPERRLARSCDRRAQFPMGGTPLLAYA